jgi:hypothetical protein
VFKDFDDCERCAGEDGFESIRGGVEKSDVLVHVEDICVGETFDIFGNRDELFNVRVLA